MSEVHACDFAEYVWFGFTGLNIPNGPRLWGTPRRRPPEISTIWGSLIWTDIAQYTDLYNFVFIGMWPLWPGLNTSLSSQQVSVITTEPPRWLCNIWNPGFSKAIWTICWHTGHNWKRLPFGISFQLTDARLLASELASVQCHRLIWVLAGPSWLFKFRIERRSN